MTEQPVTLPAVSVWPSAVGILLAIVRPGSTADDTAVCVEMPFEYARDVFLTQILAALAKHEDEYQKLVDDVDSVGDIDDIPPDPDPA